VRSGVVQALLSFLNDYFNGLIADDARPDGPEESAAPAPLFLLVCVCVCVCVCCFFVLSFSICRR
jgi:hypothetical protein